MSELDEEDLAELHKKTSAEVPESHLAGDDLGCRSKAQADESPGSWALVILLMVATLGTLLGRALILRAPDAAGFTPANKAALELWAGLVGGLCGYGLAAWVVMTRWLRHWLKIFTPGIPGSSAVGWLLAAFLTFVIVVVATSDIPAGTVNGRPVPFSHQITGFTIAGGVAALPGLIGFLALRSLAREDSQWEEKPRCQILMAVQMRRYLRRLLGALGLFLTLFVVTTAARHRFPAHAPMTSPPH